MTLPDWRFLVIDTETTGLDPAVDRVVEFAVAELNMAEGTLRSSSWLVNPERAIPPEASAVHHLVDEDVALAGDLGTVLDLAEYRFEHRDAILAAHNAAFDAGFLPKGWKPTVCTLRLARHLWPEMPKHTNQYLRYALKLEVPGAKGLAAHRAEADALVTATLLRRELEELERQHPGLMASWGGGDELAAWANRPVLLTTCFFGSKHRGVAWADVPKDYLNWVIRNVSDLDADTRFTVETMLAR